MNRNTIYWCTGVDSLVVIKYFSTFNMYIRIRTYRVSRVRSTYYFIGSGVSVVVTTWSRVYVPTYLRKCSTTLFFFFQLETGIYPVRPLNPLVFLPEIHVILL